MRKFLKIASFAATVGLCVPAYASDKDARESEDLRKLAEEFAECVVRTNAPIARGVILQNLGPEEILSSFKARHLIDGGCLYKANHNSSIYLWFGGDQFRYSLADSLMKTDYPMLRHFDFSEVPPLDHNEPKPLSAALANGTGLWAKAAQKRYATALTVTLFSRFGECVVRRNPDESQKLVLSGIGSSEENDAFSRLSSTLGECLTSGQMRLSRAVARGLVALGFYRLAGAPAGAEIVRLKD